MSVHTHTHTHIHKHTHHLLELRNEFRKTVGYKVNMESSVAFLSTNNGQPEGEMEKIIPFTIASKRIKYLGINRGDERLYH